MMFLPNVYGAGQMFAFSGLDGQTDFENCLVLGSHPERFTFEVVIPQRGTKDILILQEGAKILFPDAEVSVFASDLFAAGNSRMVTADTHHILIEGAVRIVDQERANIQVASKGKLTLVGVAEFFDPAWLDADFEALWQKHLDFFSKLDCFGVTDPDCCRALARAYSQLKGEVLSPFWRFDSRWSQPNRWPHRGCWLWDSVFHAAALRFVDMELAVELLRAIFSCQCADGRVPACESPRRISELTQPPVVAFGLSHLDVSDDVIAAFYPKLAAQLEWNFAHRDTDGNGLLEWFINGDVNCRSGESGMDNSPRFDESQMMDAPDFNALMSKECECMAVFARRLGKTAEAAQWRQRHEKLNELINFLLWNEEAGLYMDRDVATGKRTGIRANSGFFPLLCGAPDARQTARMAVLLRDPQQFGSAFRIPTLAKGEKGYNKDMWRGPVWVMVNWLIYYGLKRCGETSLAREIAEETVAHQIRYYKELGGFFEFYDDRDEVPPVKLPRKGSNTANWKEFHYPVAGIGLSAAPFIDFVHELQSASIEKYKKL